MHLSDFKAKFRELCLTIQGQTVHRSKAIDKERNIQIEKTIRQNKLLDAGSAFVLVRKKHMIQGDFLTSENTRLLIVKVPLRLLDKL